MLITERKPAGGKYGSKALFYNPRTGTTSAFKDTPECLFFASTWEFRVYRELCHLVPQECIKLQYPLVVKPATEKYPKLEWRCDFALAPTEKFQNQFFLLVEAKGLSTGEFRRNLQYLEFFRPDEYKNLVIVRDERLPRKVDKNLSTIDLEGLRRVIRWLQK